MTVVPFKPLKFDAELLDGEAWRERERDRLEDELCIVVERFRDESSKPPTRARHAGLLADADEIKAKLLALGQHHGFLSDGD